MIKNVEIWVTEKCNSRCVFCHWWQKKRVGQGMSAISLKRLLSRAEFSQMESVQISGGEPMIHHNIGEIINTIIKNLPKLKKILLATNGTFPQKTAILLKAIKKRSQINLTLSVSLDGDQAINKKIRGLDNYLSVLDTIRLSRQAVPELNVIILSTLTALNCTPKILAHLRNLAIINKAVFSFRVFYSSVHHYCHRNDLKLSLKQKQYLIKFIKKYYFSDPFLRAQTEYLETGRMPLMHKCQAGGMFVNIRADGYIYPCINSTRKIGDMNYGIYPKSTIALGEYEPCPCCDEACFYPMYNYAFSDKI